MTTQTNFLNIIKLKLDIILFEDNPDFFRLLSHEYKNHRIFNDKLRLSVLDLIQIFLATGKDKYVYCIS